MKKTYIAPQAETVEIKANTSLLTVSTPDASHANVTIGGDYNDDGSD